VAKPDLSEFGSTGLKHSGGTVYDEFLPILRGTRGAKVFREMADNDPTIGSILYAIEKVILRLDWRMEPFKDKSADGETEPQDIETSEFFQSCIEDMSDSWDVTVSSILSMLIYGYSFHEIVYKVRGGDSKDPKRRSKYNDGKIGWRKFAIRGQETIWSWMIDEEGGIQGMIQSDPSAQTTVRPIPIEKALLFRVKAQKNNPEGRSLLRNAYRPWYYKHRIEEIEAVGIERDLAGLPIAYVPPEYLSSGATADQVAFRNAIEQIVQNVKRNEQEGIVMPLMYDESGHKMFELNLLTSGGSRQFDTDKIIQRYDQRIAMSVLSDFILLGHDRVGSFSLGTAKMDLWSMAVDAIANSIAEVINQYAIPRLMKLNNMDMERPPYLTYGEVSHIDLGEIADYVSKLANSGMIISDPNLEDYLRELGGLPPADHNADSLGTAPVDDEFGLTADEQALIDDLETPDEEMTGAPTEDVE
jgi:hypothetical protein